MTLRRPGRREIVLGLFLFLIAMNVVSLFVMLARPGAADPVALAFLAGRTLLFVGLMVLYRRGWDPARHIFALSVAFFSAQTLASGITAARMPLGLMVPILVAALVSDWRGILACGLFLLAVIGWKAGPSALVQAPETLLVFFSGLVLVLLIWIVLDNARRDAEAATEELRRSMSKLEFSSILLDKVGQSIIAGDFDNRITYANERAMRLHGWTAESVVGIPVPEGLVDRTEAQYVESVAAVKAGRTWSIESTAHDNGGRAYPVLLTLSPVRTSGGEIDGWVSVAVDLSALKAAEAALAESEKRYHDLVSSLPVIAFALDRDGRYTLSDGAALPLLGREPGAVVGQSIFDIHADSPKILADLRTAFSGTAVRTEQELMGYVFDVAYTPCKDEDGRVIGVTGVSMDVTARRLAENEVQRLNRELEARVIERTAQLKEANASLVSALEELKSAQARLVLSEKLAALGQLVAGIAHQLNTPLGAMASSASVMGKELSKGFLPFMRDYAALGPHERALAEDLFLTASRIGTVIDPRGERLRRHAIVRVLEDAGVEDAAALAADLAPILDEEGARRVLPLVGIPEGRRLLDSIQSVTTAMSAGNIIANAVEKASRLVRTLKLYSGQESGGEASVRMDLRSELRSLLALYGTRYGPGIDIAFRSDGDCEILGQRGELVQVFVSLLDNACQAMGLHGRLSVEAVRLGDRVLVSVADSGPGIDEAVRPRIFEPFFTTRKGGEGTGLGLDIARRIVERHAGNISFESEPGHTVFTVDLPGA